MKKILIVDDNERIRELVFVTLDFQDYHILEASTGAKAVELARSEKPDLILLDVMMPGEIDGLQATRILKSDPLTRDIVIILLTANGQEQDKIEGLKTGADDYFIKPFSPTDLIRRIETVLG